MCVCEIISKWDEIPVNLCPVCLITAIFCGQVIPARVLLQNSQNAVLLFSSDVNEAGQGFVVRHRAVKGPFPPGRETAKHAANSYKLWNSVGKMFCLYKYV